MLASYFEFYTFICCFRLSVNFIIIAPEIICKHFLTQTLYSKPFYY